MTGHDFVRRFEFSVVAMAVVEHFLVNIVRIGDPFFPQRFATQESPHHTVNDQCRIVMFVIVDW